MSILSLKRLASVAAGATVAMAAAVPASALTIGLGGSSLVRVQDCRSAALTRHNAYDVDFSSNSTGPVHVHTGVVADGSVTLCYSLDASALTAAQVTAWTDVTLNALVASLLGEADASHVCSAVRLQLAPGVKGTVSATIHAHVVVDGAPPADYDQSLAKDTVVNTLGENILLKACTDTNGNASVA